MARPSNMSHRHLPPGASNGQVVKCVGGRIIWTTETPGGVVTEAGANAANAIGAASGADTSAKIKTLLGNASESNYGVVKLASNGVATAGRAVEAIDNRLSDDRTPKTHQSTHRIGGTDALPLAAQNLPGLMELTPGLAVITALFSKVGGQSPSSLLSFNGIYLGSSKIADIVKTPLVILSGGCPTDYVL
jgi:hypothetical protein